MMTPAEFINQAFDHYNAKLAEEKSRWGVLGISARFIGHHAHKIYDDDDGGMLWRNLSEQSGLHLIVTSIDDPQIVYAILSKNEIPNIKQLCGLLDILEKINDYRDRCFDLNGEPKLLAEFELELIQELDCYNDPYKLEVPSALMAQQ